MFYIDKNNIHQKLSNQISLIDCFFLEKYKQNINKTYCFDI